MGRYSEAEKKAREALYIEEQRQDERMGTPFHRDLAMILGFQDKYTEAEQHFQRCLNWLKPYGEQKLMQRGLAFERLGLVLARKGDFEVAKDYLQRGLEIKYGLKFLSGIQEPLMWLGMLAETQGNLDHALNFYEQGLEFKWYGSYHYNSTILTGLVRVKHAQGMYQAIPPLLAEAEQLAQQYEYNDHLVSLRLTQAQTFQVSKNLEGLTALDYFKQAMIYALRYNRLLLDEVLSGRPQGTPLRPIIPCCLERGEEGHKLLVALRDWWETGIKDIGTPRPDTISPIPEGISLLEAERIAREREPGDGSAQKSVVEQIEAVL